MKKMIVMLALLTAATALYAGSSNATYSRVEHVKVKGNGDVLVYVGELEHTDCSDDPGAYVIKSSSGLQYESQVQMALIAFKEGSGVTIEHYDEQCDGDNPILHTLTTL